MYLLAACEAAYSLRVQRANETFDSHLPISSTRAGYPRGVTTSQRQNPAELHESPFQYRATWRPRKSHPLDAASRMFRFPDSVAEPACAEPSTDDGKRHPGSNRAIATWKGDLVRHNSQ